MPTEVGEYSSAVAQDSLNRAGKTSDTSNHTISNIFLLATIHGTLPILLFINLNANFNKFQNTNPQSPLSLKSAHGVLGFWGFGFLGFWGFGVLGLGVRG